MRSFFTMHKSTRKRFRGGAVRSDRKLRFDLVPHEFLEALAEVLTAGAETYGAYNWQRGQRDFFIDAWNHAFVHLQMFKEGDRSEDHLAQLACNVLFLIWAVKHNIVRRRISGGRTSGDYAVFGSHS